MSYDQSSRQNDFWNIPLKELADMIGGNLGQSTQREAELVFQARIAIEGARIVAEEARNTTKTTWIIAFGTWVLAVGTWALVVVDLILRISFAR